MEKGGVHPDVARNAILHIERFLVFPLRGVDHERKASGDADDSTLVFPFGIQDQLPILCMEDLDPSLQPLVIVGPVLNPPRDALPCNLIRLPLAPGSQ